MIPVVAIRPEPGLSATLHQACEAGLDARGWPLFAVRGVAWKCPDPETYDALLLGSANALRHAGPALDRWKGRTAHVVGQPTARAAEADGLVVGAVGSGGLQSVLDTLAGAPLHLLRLTGRERVTLDPPPGMRIDERVVYASEPLPMPADLAALLRAPAVMLLHSGEAARHFAAECARTGLDRSVIALAAIGDRVAEAAGDGWRLVASAARPDEAALLALAGELCQTP